MLPLNPKGLGLGRKVLTQQREDASQDSQKGAGAQAGGRVGHGAARQGRAGGVALAHADRQRVGAAQCRAAAVHDQHGQPVRRLLPPSEAASLGQYGCRVIWKERVREKDDVCIQSLRNTNSLAPLTV